MGQIITTQNLVAIKVVRHAGQWRGPDVISGLGSGFPRQHHSLSGVFNEHDSVWNHQTEYVSISWRHHDQWRLIVKCAGWEHVSIKFYELGNAKFSFKKMCLKCGLSRDHVYSDISIGDWTNGRHFADDIFKCILFNEHHVILTQLSMMVIQKVWMTKKSAMVQVIVGDLYQR